VVALEATVPYSMLRRTFGYSPILGQITTDEERRANSQLNAGEPPQAGLRVMEGTG
jgi:hypothetical protein